MKINEKIFEPIDVIAGDRTNESGKAMAMARIAAEGCDNTACLMKYLLFQMDVEFRRMGTLQRQQNLVFPLQDRREAWVRCQVFRVLLERMLDDNMLKSES